MIEFLERVFAPLTGLLGNGLEFFYSLGAPWWLSIAILTVIVRSILFPLTVRQVKSMRAMQDLKPDMDRIRAKYKDNRQKQQEEIMKLYQERQINPFGSCFPLLVQMPIFSTMFYVIRSFGDTHPSFTSGGILWFPDLSVHDPYYILPVLSALTMLAASEITAKSLDPQQRWMMRVLPVAFTIFLLNFPAGLFMYWITSNLVTLAQNYVIYNHGPGKRPPANEAKSSKPGNRNGSTNGGSATRATADRQQDDGSDERKSSQANTDDDRVAQAAKLAKRKRRRKKKR
jgi:YidC/Oxa1 family membrane protein insertase